MLIKSEETKKLRYDKSSDKIEIADVSDITEKLLTKRKKSNYRLKVKRMYGYAPKLRR